MYFWFKKILMEEIGTLLYLKSSICLLQLWYFGMNMVVYQT